MSFFLKKMPAAGSLYSVLIQNNFDVKKIEESLERDSSCITNEVTYVEPPLCVALRNKHCSSDIVRLLLKYGATVNVSCFISSVTPLIAALEASKDEEVIRLLLENGANINVFMAQQTPLCIALQNDASKGVVQLLLDGGCPLNGCKRHDSVLFCATDNTRTGLKEDVLHLLIERGADVNAVDRNGQSVLCFALSLCAKVHDIGLLLSAGTSLSACTRHLSALLCATEQNSFLKADVVKLLLDEGAHADDLDALGRTPLQRALVSCEYETEAIRLLLGCHQGDEVYNVVTNLRRNLLHLAVMNVKCKPSVVELLIKRGFLIKARDVNGETALHIAAMNQVKTSVIEMLVKSGAVVNMMDRYFKTAFQLAVEFWLSTDIIKLLLYAGSRVTTRNPQSPQFLLESALDRTCAQQRMGYSEKNTLDCSLLIMKYYFLETPQFDFPELVRSHKEYKAFSQFSEDCVLELRKMESVMVGPNLTLLDFLINSPTPRETDKSTRGETNYDFNQLLEKIADYEFPLFFDIISVKVGRPAMEAKLQEVQVYCLPNMISIEEEIILDYYCTCEIIQYLQNDDLLRLIVTFNNTNDRACTSGQASEENNRGNKRSSEESDQCFKHLKPSPEFL